MRGDTCTVSPVSSGRCQPSASMGPTGTDFTDYQIDTSDWTFGSPGSPPSSPIEYDAEQSVNQSPERSHNMNDPGVSSSKMDENEVETSSSSESYQLKQSLNEMTRYAYRLKTELKEVKKERTEILKEANREIISIQTVWRDIIYYERSRAGKILKTAMQTGNM